MQGPNKFLVKCLIFTSSVQKKKVAYIIILWTLLCCKFHFTVNRLRKTHRSPKFCIQITSLSLVDVGFSSKLVPFSTLFPLRMVCSNKTYRILTLLHYLLTTKSSNVCLLDWDCWAQQLQLVTSHPVEQQQCPDSWSISSNFHIQHCLIWYLHLTS